MSKIEELIKEYCSDGVEYKELGDICVILDNQRLPVSKDKRIKGQYPYYGANGIQDYVNDYIFDGTYLLIGEDGSVINDDKTPVLNWSIGKIWVNNHAHVLKEKENIIKLRYLYYYLSTVDISSLVRGLPPKLNQQNLKTIEIPIPPIAIQEEIVNILDTFTELEAELEAELVLRKKQYHYYRDKLLDFGTEQDNIVPWISLDELLDYIQPSKFIIEKDNLKDEGVPVLTAGKTFILGYTKEKNGIFIADKNNPVIIFDDFTTSFHWVDFNFKVKSSAIKILKPKNEDFCFKYIYYIMKIIKYSTLEHSRQWISKFSNFKVPVPPLSEQERIVNILDKFESLVNDISIGLPAEINARQQQYKYYRNKLLSFNKI